MPRPDLDYSSSPDPASAAAAVQSERSQHLRQLQLESLAVHAANLPIFVTSAACFVGFIVWDSAPAPLVLGWIAALVAILLARRWFSRSYKKLNLDVETALRVMVVLSACNGIVQGGGVALFFGGLSLEKKALITMIMVCLAAGAVSASAPYSRSFYAWAIPLFAALAGAWALAGGVTDMWIALLLVLFPAAQAVFVRDNEKVLRDSFDIRYERVALIRELEHQRAAVAVERDRAEEANRAKSRFLASASHDLRQPLHTLALYSAALSARKTDERTQEMAREIGTAIQSLGTLLDALLDISKLDAGAVQPQPTRFGVHVRLERLAAEFRPLAAQKRLAFETELQPAFVQSDPVLFERVVRNLLDNAIKYTARGSIRLRLAIEGARAVIEIADTGSGIPRNEHGRIFEEFFQLANPERDRSKGIGLGLAIVRRLTDLLWIDLTLDSEVGQGTTFRLSMPLAEQPAAREELPVVDEGDSVELPKGLRALVVDDEGSVRRGMQTLLESWGFAVSLSSGVGAALQMLADDEPQLLIADYRLRGGETGADLVRRAREARPDIAALLVTGDTTSELAHEVADLGIGLLRKPVEQGVLRRAIASALAGRRAIQGRDHGADGMAVGGRRKARG
jgi:signal transduction histidine kinase/CheY-like chemotaxis protein